MEGRRERSFRPRRVQYDDDVDEGDSAPVVVPSQGRRIQPSGGEEKHTHRRKMRVSTPSNDMDEGESLSLRTTNRPSKFKRRSVGISVSQSEKSAVGAYGHSSSSLEYSAERLLELKNQTYSSRAPDVSMEPSSEVPGEVRIPSESEIALAKKQRKEKIDSALRSSGDGSIGNGRSGISRSIHEDELDMEIDADDGTGESSRMAFGSVEVRDEFVARGEADRQPEMLRWEQEQIQKGTGAVRGALTFDDDELVGKSGQIGHGSIQDARLVVKNVADTLSGLVSRYEAHVNELARCEVEMDSIVSDVKTADSEMENVAEMFSYHSHLKEWGHALIAMLRGEFMRKLESVEETVDSNRKRLCGLRLGAKFSLWKGPVNLPSFCVVPPNNVTFSDEFLDCVRSGADFSSLLSISEDEVGDLIDMDEDEHSRSVECVFEDAVDEIASLDAVVGKFRDWQSRFPSTFARSYASLVVSPLLSPYVRASLLDWNPLRSAASIAQLNWYRSVVEWDVPAATSLIQNVVVPYVVEILSSAFDPFDVEEAERLCVCCEELRGLAGDSFELVRKAMSDRFGSIIGAKLYSSGMSDEQMLHVTVFGVVRLGKSLSKLQRFVLASCWEQLSEEIRSVKDDGPVGSFVRESCRFILKH